MYGVIVTLVEVFVVRQFGLPIAHLASEASSFKVHCVCVLYDREKGAMEVRGGFDSIGHPDPSLPLHTPLFRP